MQRPCPAVQREKAKTHERIVEVASERIREQGLDAGCAVAALGVDVRRGDERVRSAYRRQVQRYVENVERFPGRRR